MVSTYLDDYNYDVQVIAESVYQKDSSEAQAEFEQKSQIMAAYFPQIMLANQDVIFEDFTTAFGDDKSRYNLTPQQPAAPIGEEGGSGGVPENPIAPVNELKVV